MIVKKPPMGWNTWNTFGENINEELIRSTADALVSTGLKDAGYEYLIIDDCWSKKERDENGRLQPDPEKFPSGMKALADYVHSKGLKFGMYSCCGPRTCADYPGSFNHEFVDAKTFASWGVDYLKYDHCYKPETSPSDMLYRKMGLALANCGRDILYSACSWGINGTPDWIKTTGAHMWRSTGDIFDVWGRVDVIYNANVPLQPINGKGCFNDMDMLIVGMHGSGNVGMGGCTTEEYRTHMSIWAMFSSPLIIGCDIRNVDEETSAMLKNREVIAINQDEACQQPFEVKFMNGVWGTFWVKYLENGDVAILALNMTDKEMKPYLPLADAGYAQGIRVTVRDVWTGEETTAVDAFQIKRLPSHSSKLFRCSIRKEAEK